MNPNFNKGKEAEIFTFVPQPVPGSAGPHFEAVYHKGERIGCAKSSSNNGWFALTEPEDEAITSDKGKGLHYFDSKVDAAKRLLEIARIRKSFVRREQ